MDKHFLWSKAIGLVFILGSIILGIKARRSTESKSKQHLTGFCYQCLGLGFLILGGIGWYEIHSSPRLTKNGALQSLSQSHGRSESSSFTLHTADGDYPLHTVYAGPNLQNGQSIEVSFVLNTGTVIHLSVQAPEDHRGFELHEDDDHRATWVLCIMGLWLIAHGLYLTGKSSGEFISG